jgi:hypothetical protein
LAQEATDLTKKVRHAPEKEVDFMTFRMALMDERRAAHKEGREEGIKEGRQEGGIAMLCKAVAEGVMNYTDALKLSGCTKDEFSAWMKQFHPDYKI